MKPFVYFSLFIVFCAMSASCAKTGENSYDIGLSTIVEGIRKGKLVVNEPDEEASPGEEGTHEPAQTYVIRGCVDDEGSKTPLLWDGNSIFTFYSGLESFEADKLIDECGCPWSSREDEETVPECEVYVEAEGFYCNGHKEYAITKIKNYKVLKKKVKLRKR